MKNVRTVIWDCDNVMWFHKKNEAEIVAKALKITSIEEIEEFSEQFVYMLEAFNRYFYEKRVTEKELFKLIAWEMPILDFYGISAKKFMEVWNGLKFEVNDFNKDTLIVLEDLKQKGIKNIVKSDWWREVQEHLLKGYGILEYIEELHCCDNQYLKYNPLVVNEVIKSERKEQYVMIGDSVTSDICFAHNAGIKSIWFNRDEKENKTPYKPTFEIASLLEVMEIIL